ncbi:MAG: hypothetical protein AABY22_10925, partial [Nanoarchaeota archaeon]
MEINKKVYMIMIVSIVIISLFSANHFYYKGYDKGVSELEDFKQELNLYHTEWGVTGVNKE